MAEMGMTVYNLYTNIVYMYMYQYGGIKGCFCCDALNGLWDVVALLTKTPTSSYCKTLPPSLALWLQIHTHALKQTICNLQAICGKVQFVSTTSVCAQQRAGVLK